MSLETETLEMITHSLEQYSKGSHNPSKDKKVIRRIRKIKSTKNGKLALSAAQWILQFHMESLNNCGNNKQMASVLKNAANDMEHALNLLEIKFNNPNEEMQALIISTDIAQKISRFDKLGPLYTKLKAMAITNQQLNFMILSVAPTMGDWSSFYEICNQMEKEYASVNKSQDAASGKKSSLSDALHTLGEEGMPDLGVIYSYVKEFKLYENASAKTEELFENTIEVKKAEVELIRVIATDESRKEEIKEMFEKEKEKEINLDEITIAVNGGLVLMTGISREIPQMLAGPYFDQDKIEAEAYTDLQLSEQDEDGKEKLSFNSPEFAQEVMGAMPPEIREAIESGQIDPSTLYSVMGIIKQGAEEASARMPNMSPALKAGFIEFAKRFEEKQPELKKRFGQSIVRQQERVSLRKVENGYEGEYIVRNYNPVEKGEETAIELSIKLECDHLMPPASGNTGDICAGLDGLTLE